jgi:hypothetical protein
MDDYIELLSFLSISERELPPELPEDDVLVSNISISELSERRLSADNNLLTWISLPSAPYPLQGGEEPTELKDLRVKIINTWRR